MLENIKTSCSVISTDTIRLFVSSDLWLPKNRQLSGYLMCVAKEPTAYWTLTFQWLKATVHVSALWAGSPQAWQGALDIQVVKVWWHLPSPHLKLQLRPKHMWFCAARYRGQSVDAYQISETMTQTKIDLIRLCDWHPHPTPHGPGFSECFKSTCWTLAYFLRYLVK